MSAQPENVIYLTVDDVLTLYAVVFDCTEQEAEAQLLDREKLEGALGRPKTYAYYEGADIATQAAAVAHAIAESQSFVEGNKRTAALAVLTFLDENGYRFDPPFDRALAHWILALSEPSSEDEPRPIEGRITLEEFADLIRQHIVPLDK